MLEISYVRVGNFLVLWSSTLPRSRAHYRDDQFLPEILKYGKTSLNNFFLGVGRLA